MIRRSLTLPVTPTGSFFLWGPRQVGKSSLLKTTHPPATRVDLLRTDEYVRYLQRPSLLRDELRDAAPATLTLIDEVQKVPALLDEVHWLIESRSLVFRLCGSSARKVRRGHANMPGGRAVRYELFGLVHHELTAYREYRDREWDLSYWRLASGIEVDFVVHADRIAAAIEVKSTARVHDNHLAGLRAIAKDQKAVARRLLVCLEPRRRVTLDGIEIVPVTEFLRRLWADKVV